MIAFIINDFNDFFVCNMVIYFRQDKELILFKSKMGDYGKYRKKRKS